MNKVLPLISLFIMSIISIFYWAFKPKEVLYEAKWNAPDTTIAITINGEISTTFPTTDAYDTSVECTSGTGSIEWNGTKWILTTSGITKGSTKCNAIFNKKLTLAERILADNEIKTPLTTPGSEESAHTLNDAVAISVVNVFSNYYITYGTGWKANGKKFNLTGTAVTTDTYANSYSSLVGNYLVDYYSYGSSTAGKMLTTTGLWNVFYVVSASSSELYVKPISSNKNITEALLASTKDDYGTSYYFRGAVKNNYVQFANKCWRIVRIVGDGSVKLVLHNDNTSNVSNPCASVNNSSNAAFARYSGTKFQSAFNSESGDNAYIGYMYGTSGASDYVSTHANTNKSTILINLETWYKNNLISYENKLADTIWCNNKSTSSGLGYGTNATSYTTGSSSTPTLICHDDNNGGKLSKFTVSDTTHGNGNLDYKIGLLTLDELKFSGLSGASNTSTYLFENSGNGWWWTMSPSDYHDITYIWHVNHIGQIETFVGITDDCLRPAISLASFVTASGTGTSEDPYIIN